MALLVTACISTLSATHNRAGEITYVQIGDQRIRVTITTYTKASKVDVDRDSLEIFWGDGTSELVVRANGSGEVLQNDIKRNFYIAEHTYPGLGKYKIGVTDPNRVANILNVNPPNSVKIKFHLETEFTLLNPQFQGRNSSAQLLQPPLDYGCIGQPFVHDANAFDADGDSLAYELVQPLQAAGEPVPNYLFPDQINPSDSNRLSLDPISGILIWDAPQIQGEYNVAIKIYEYRNGFLLNTIIRDMQILIEDCDNEVPTLEAPNEICVVAGKKISFDVVGNDPDVNQKIRLSAIGSPFEQSSNPASFSAVGTYVEIPSTGVFEWQTDCSHIAKRPYKVVFRVEDNYNRGQSGLSTLKTTNIKVAAPPPTNMQLDINENGNLLRWRYDVDCISLASLNFQGFVIWRREGFTDVAIDTCGTDLTTYGYEMIDMVAYKASELVQMYQDNTAESDVLYCYRITAKYAQISDGGNAFNTLESLPSQEVCSEFKRNRPLLTKVSVSTTDASEGSISLAYLLPLEEDITVANFQSPYTAQIYYGNSSATVTNAIESSRITVESLDGTERESAHAIIDTESGGFYYKVKITDKNGQQIESPISASLYLNTAPRDERIDLDWEVTVSWKNKIYYIYRKDSSGMYALLDSTVQNMYSDLNVINGETYCYYIQSKGLYEQFMDAKILYNDSQESCATPMDNEPPCKPTLSVLSGCDNPSGQIFKNEISWQPSCNDDDIDFYQLYFSTSGQDFEILEDNIVDLSFSHEHKDGIIGCYTVRAVDQNGNVSSFSDTLCVESCPKYELPNVFTPNDDGHNDRLVPRKSQFINSIDFKVYNRWGNIVFQTTEPRIDWDGKTTSGAKVSAGSYYYVCQVYYIDRSGERVALEALSGNIEIIY